MNSFRENIINDLNELMRYEFNFNEIYLLRIY